VGLDSGVQGAVFTGTEGGSSSWENEKRRGEKRISDRTLDVDRSRARRLTEDLEAAGQQTHQRPQYSLTWTAREREKRRENSFMRRNDPSEKTRTPKKRFPTRLRRGNKGLILEISRMKQGKKRPIRKRGKEGRETTTRRRKRFLIDHPSV